MCFSLSTTSDNDDDEEEEEEDYSPYPQMNNKLIDSPFHRDNIWTFDKWALNRGRTTDCVLRLLYLICKIDGSK